jgi:hypothetical protein
VAGKVLLVDRSFGGVEGAVNLRNLVFELFRVWAMLPPVPRGLFRPLRPRLFNSRRYPGGPIFGNYHAVSPCTGRAPDQCPKIVRVLYFIQHEEHTAFSRITTDPQNVVKLGIGKWLNLEDHTLMMFTPAQPGNIDLLAVADRNPLFRRKLEQFFQSFVRDAAGYIKFKGSPVTAGEPQERVNAVE